MTSILLLLVGGGAKLAGGGGIQELGLGTPPNSFGGRIIDPDSTGLKKEYIPMGVFIHIYFYEFIFTFIGFFSIIYIRMNP